MSTTPHPKIAVVGILSEKKLTSGWNLKPELDREVAKTPHYLGQSLYQFGSGLKRMISLSLSKLICESSSAVSILLRCRLGSSVVLCGCSSSTGVL